jgi:peptide-methionine (S)-S-oxide reductase
LTVRARGARAAGVDDDPGVRRVRPAHDGRAVAGSFDGARRRKMANEAGADTDGGAQRATLAGGCFWCLEAVYSEMEGVRSAVSGYMGGEGANPSYREVCSGDTGHAEVVQLQFDPGVVSYRELLEVFFVIHDPTTLNRQGNDVGSQYRSAIFWHTPQQKAEAESLIAALTAQRAFSGPIVTEVTPATTFWPAEAYHQRYFRDNAYQPYCQVVVAPKLAKFRKKFAARLKRAGR